jgi:hypothetical protein
MDVSQSRCVNECVSDIYNNPAGDIHWKTIEFTKPSQVLTPTVFISYLG